MLGDVFVTGGETYLRDLVSKHWFQLGYNGHGWCLLTGSS